MTDPTDKSALLAELLPLMAANGTDAALLDTMRQPEWLAKVSLENLQFLLRQHRELEAAHRDAEGLYERWQRGKKERRPDPGPA